MVVYTMGFTQKSAEDFFELVKKNHISILVDIRLNNQSQLAGFTKGRDLAYFLKEIAGCKYVHDLVFAPTKELLNDYKKGAIDWDGYVEVFDQLIERRRMVEHFDRTYKDYDNVLLLCSEATPEQCHRRLVAEAISGKCGYEVRHI